MTDTPKPPKRRRRRIIVAVALVLVSLVSWWYWPRGDARFVGKWTMETLASDSFPAIKVGDLLLRRHGIAMSSDAQGRLQCIPWCVNSSKLMLGPPNAWPDRPELVSRALRWFGQLSGINLDGDPMVFEIKTIGANEITLTWADGDSDLVLRRIRE
jgi:hypothetical protein